MIKFKPTTFSAQKRIKPCMEILLIIWGGGKKKRDGGLILAELFLIKLHHKVKVFKRTVLLSPIPQSLSLTAIVNIWNNSQA